MPGLLVHILQEAGGLLVVSPNAENLACARAQPLFDTMNLLVPLDKQLANLEAMKAHWTRESEMEKARAREIDAAAVPPSA